MTLHPAILALNHLLAREAWARERLVPFAGRTLQLRLPPLPDLVMLVSPAGQVEQARAPERADLVIRLKPGMLPLLLTRDERLAREAEIDGDTEFGAAVMFVFRNLRWDAEEDLSRVVGDAAAHRVARTGRSFFAWQRDAVLRLGENVAEYLREESNALARPEDVRAFGRDVAEVRDAVERLEKRLERLGAARKP
jgi:ubiquinone biosynthesis protein UbiJ